MPIFLLAELFEKFLMKQIMRVGLFIKINKIYFILYNKEYFLH